MRTQKTEKPCSRSSARSDAMTPIKTFLVCAPLLAALVGAGATAGCGDEGTAAVATDYSALLKDLTERVALPAYQAAADKADALVVATKALEATPTAESLSAAQKAWREARAAYRRLDAVASFGPLPTLAIDARIDVYPADPSGIEQLVKETAPIDADYVGRLGGKKKGYLGVEYLLFAGPGGDVLAGFAPAGRRGSLARALAEEIATSMHQVYDGWDPAKGGLAKEILDPGQAGSSVPSQRHALDNFVGGGAFALENVVGLRLAIPLGRKSKDGQLHPELDPTSASDSANADCAASMQGVLALYQTPGFTTYIRPKATALDDKATAEMNDCVSKLAAIPQPFDAAITQSTPLVQQAYDACKAYKLTWNTDITSTLGATLKPLDPDGD